MPFLSPDMEFLVIGVWISVVLLGVDLWWASEPYWLSGQYKSWVVFHPTLSGGWLCIVLGPKKGSGSKYFFVSVFGSGSESNK